MVTLESQANRITTSSRTEEKCSVQVRTVHAGNASQRITLEECRGRQWSGKVRQGQDVMGLPFAPEKLEALQKRLPVAFGRLWDAAEISRTGDRPGLYREYVFDTEQGIRLIISKDASDGEEVLHISGSIDGKYLDHWRQKIIHPQDAIVAVLASFKEISGLDETGVAISDITDGGVVHLVYPLLKPLVQ